MRRRQQSDPSPAVLAVIPAHDEQDSIAATLDSLLAQDTPVAHILVVAADCTDNTEAIVEGYRHRGVSLLRIVDNKDRKVGALLQAWHAASDLGYDLWLGVDADTILERDCLTALVTEVQAAETVGGAMAKYSFDQTVARGLTARFLFRMQRLEFAGWINDLLQRRRVTYVLGGQASLFRMEALRKVAAMPGRDGPWSTHTLVEDMELTWRLNEIGYQAMVADGARAWPGAMPSWRALWGQRRKWDQGVASLLHDDGRTNETVVPWRMQYKILLDFLVRILFFVMLAVSLVFAMFTWFWIWLLPPVLAILLNLKLALVMPRRTLADVLIAATLIGPEIYLMFRLACWSRSWAGVLRGTKFDGWAAQQAAEAGQRSGRTGARLATFAVAGAALTWAAANWEWIPKLRIWQADAGQWVSTAAGIGWWLVTALTVVSTVEMAWRLLRKDHGMRP